MLLYIHISVHEKADSKEAALFISKAYKKLIDEYFPNCFFELTGNGLLVDVSCEKREKKLVGEVLETCLRVLSEFPSFCVDDGAIYFQDRVPKKITIGISRGVASRLASGNKTLDYSGRPFNLAS